MAGRSGQSWPSLPGSLLQSTRKMALWQRLVADHEHEKVVADDLRHRHLALRAVPDHAGTGRVEHREPVERALARSSWTMPIAALATTTPANSAFCQRPVVITSTKRARAGR